MLTPRLRLRELIADDVDGIFRLYSQPETMRYWSCPPYRERRQAEELLTRVAQGHEAGDLLEWGVELLDSGRLIGTLTLHQLDVGNQRAELGYLLERDFWGRGLMGEALLPVLQFAFDDRGLGLHRLEADTDPRNAGSVKLLERLGFRLEGLLRERWCVAGEFSDSAMYGLLRREWQTGRAAE
jgi:RimJ/RimL family protein N-acetyltransferase